MSVQKTCPAGRGMPKMLSLQHEIWNMGCTMAVVGGCVFAVNRILEQREIGVKKI